MSDQQTVPDYRQDALNLIKEHVSRQGVENHPISEMAPTYSDEDFRAAELEGKEFRPMEVEPAAPKEKSFDSDLPGLREASSELQQKRRAAERPVTLREYRSIDKDGTFGDKRPPHETRTAADAADDLTKLRQAERSAEADFENMSLRGRIDHFRAQADAADRGGATPTQPADLQPQPEAQPDVPPGVDPELAKMLANPKLREAVNQEIAGAEQARQAYVQAIYSAGQAQLAGIVAAFPELSNLNAQQLDGALRLMSQQNPQRFAEFSSHAQRLQTIAGQFRQAQAQEAQRVAQQTKTQMAQWDSEFDEATKNDPDIKRVRSEIVNVARDHYGISEKDLAATWQNEGWIHHPAVQRVFADAVRYRLSLQGIKKARAVNRPVQRPGVDSGYRESLEDAQVREAMTAFSRDSNPRNAGKALAAKRRAALR